MRRPLKPFVTEYRGGSRRQTAGAPASKPDFSNLDMELPPAEPRAASMRLADTQEDSYEAAMRAADALFAARQPAPEPDETSESSAAHPSGGRVLRVLDEPPSPELLRLEEERAPKRRGRKPGSKNKPKPSAPSVAQAAGETWPHGEVSGLEGPEDEAWPGEEAWSEHDAPAPTTAGPNRIGAMALVAVRTAPAAVPRPGDRYAWVRTKLKPGQQWKRRLPKVAW